MKKLSLKNLKLDESNVLQRDQLKTITGGEGLLDLNGDGGSSVIHWVSCTDGETYQVLDCDGWAEGFCISIGHTMTSCSSWY